MRVTFQRYVHADVEVFEDQPEVYGELSLDEQMKKLFEGEMEECRFPAYKIVEVRQRAQDRPAVHWFEYVLEFPSLEGKTPVEIAREFQKEQYDERGMSGFFQVGDHNFEW
jgi:hypothetical protein